MIRNQRDKARGNKPSWLARLRRQPGFRTAAMAFVLTVVLGVGGTTAYALWGARGTATFSVTAQVPVVAAPSNTACDNGRTGLSAATVSWQTRPPSEHTNVLVVVSKGSTSLKFVMNATTTDFVLRSKPIIENTFGQANLTVSVSNVVLKDTTPRDLGPAQELQGVVASKPGGQVTVERTSVFGYRCR